MGIMLVSYDRPGFGRSTRQEGRDVVDCASDVRVIADALNIDKFGVLGRSGGGPHALACAAKMPDRVSCVAVLAGLAPKSEEDFDWSGGMIDSNRSVFDADTESAIKDIESRVEQIRGEPETLLLNLQPKLTLSDKRVVLGDMAIRELLIDSYKEALRSGGGGWIDDVLALRKPWGFELSEVTPTTILWYGEDDPFTPVSHAEQVRKGLTNALVETIIVSNKSHFDTLEVMLGMLRKMRLYALAQRKNRKFITD
jgi:pimeloyl-ACP methyl ester carboxylesterase